MNRHVDPRAIVVGAAVLWIGLAACSRTVCGPGTVEQNGQCVPASTSVRTSLEPAKAPTPPPDPYALDHYGVFVRRGPQLIELVGAEDHGPYAPGFSMQAAGPSLGQMPEIVIYSADVCRRIGETVVARLNLVGTAFDSRQALYASGGYTTLGAFKRGPVVGHESMCRLWTEQPLPPGRYFLWDRPPILGVPNRVYLFQVAQGEEVGHVGQ